jgi:predicted DNA binding CopG/RHH family protein
MAKSKRKIDPLPDHFNSLEEAGEFWDTHDTTDYEEYMIPVHFDVDLKSSVHEVRIVHDLLSEVTKIARRQGLKTETLINVWLQEKVSEHRRRSSRKNKQAARQHSPKRPTRAQNGAARSAKP